MPKKIGENRGESWFYVAITVFGLESVVIDAEEFAKASFS